MVTRPTTKLMPKESAVLSKVMSEGVVRFRYTMHCRKEMAKNNIIEADVRHILKRYGVSWVEWKQDELWHVQGKDVDGRSIRLIIVVNATDVVVKLVTAMAL
jgi:ABC-type molybdate transport system ATPase subunit